MASSNGQSSNEFDADAVSLEEAVARVEKSRATYHAALARREELLEDYYEESPKVKACEEETTAEAKRYPGYVSEARRLCVLRADELRAEIERLITVEGMRPDGKTVSALKAQLEDLTRLIRQYPEDEIAQPKSFEDVKFVYANYTERQLTKAKEDAARKEAQEKTARQAAEREAAEETARMKARFARSLEGEFAGERALVTAAGIDCVFCWVPPGVFPMGSPDTEDGRDDDELLHEVTLTQGYWMQQTPVTQDLWRAVTGGNPSQFKGDRLPVENVSWEDRREFIEKLNAAGCAPAGLVFRSPTEAEWERACRAGYDGPYGGKTPAEISWFYDNSGRTTHEVGLKRPNAWNLYDMHGNVWEWCEDWYGEYDSDRIDPPGAREGAYRVYRGGSWFSSAELCRAAARSGGEPTTRSRDLGLRLVLSAAR